MANRTVDPTATLRGGNPQFAVDKIVRTRVYESRFWKEHCFALTAATLVDRAAELKAAGGTYGGNRRPSEFLCLALKMLQLTPEKEIVLALLRNENLKYVRVLAAFYWRLVARPRDVYAELEPLLADHRRVRVRLGDGSFVVRHVDEIADELLTESQCFDVALPRITPRRMLEQQGVLKPRRSKLVDMGVLSADGEEL